MNPKITIVGIILVIAGMFYFGLIGTASLVNIQLQENGYTTEPIKTGTFNFAGVEGTYETTWLGTLSSKSGSGGRITTDYTIKIDGDNDGERIIANTLDSSGNTLKLYSKNQIVGSNNGGDNYIEAKVLLPPGIVKVDYSYSLSQYYSDSVRIKFKFGSETKTIRLSSNTRPSSTSGSDNYEFVLTEPTEVTFRVDTIVVQKNENLEGTLNINFEPTVTSTQIESQTQETQPSIIEPVEKVNSWIQRFIDWIRSLFQ